MNNKEKTPNHIDNILDLDKFLFDKGGSMEPVLFKKFMDGMKNINTTHFNNREQDIQLFLKNIFNGRQIIPHENNSLTWFDLSEYKEMTESINKDKDRSGTSALKDVKILKKPLEIYDFSIFEKLEEQLPNFSDVIKYYRGAFVINKTRDESLYSAPRPVLLLGDAGIGKTVFANTLAKYLKTPYKFFDSNSISTSWSLSGCSPSWRGADAGLIFKTLAESETISPIITLDEIDKLENNRQNSPFSLFHQMFEKENARRFYDEYLKFYFDTSNIIYVLTANNINHIPASLLSRMEVFHIPNPDKEQMNKISQSIYEKEINGSSFFNKKLDDEQLSLLSSLKPRDVQKIISASIYTQLSNNVNNIHLKDQSLNLIIKDSPIKSMGF